METFKILFHQHLGFQQTDDHSKGRLAPKTASRTPCHTKNLAQTVRMRKREGVLWNKTRKKKQQHTLAQGSSHSRSSRLVGCPNYLSYYATLLTLDTYTVVYPVHTVPTYRVTHTHTHPQGVLHSLYRQHTRCCRTESGQCCFRPSREFQEMTVVGLSAAAAAAGIVAGAGIAAGAPSQPSLQTCSAHALALAPIASVLGWVPAVPTTNFRIDSRGTTRRLRLAQRECSRCFGDGVPDQIPCQKRRCSRPLQRLQLLRPQPLLPSSSDTRGARSCRSSALGLCLHTATASSSGIEDQVGYIFRRIMMHRLYLTWSRLKTEARSRHPGAFFQYDCSLP